MDRELYFKARKLGLSKKSATEFAKVMVSAHRPSTLHSPKMNADFYKGQCSCGWVSENPGTQHEALSSAIAHAVSKLPVEQAKVEQARQELLDIKHDLENPQ